VRKAFDRYIMSVKPNVVVSLSDSLASGGAQRPIR